MHSLSSTKRAPPYTIACDSTYYSMATGDTKQDLKIYVWRTSNNHTHPSTVQWCQVIFGEFVGCFVIVVASPAGLHGNDKCHYLYHISLGAIWGHKISINYANIQKSASGAFVESFIFTVKSHNRQYWWRRLQVVTVETEM